MKRLLRLLKQCPRLQYLFFPLLALLGLGIAAFIAKSLLALVSTGFSYD